MRARIRPTTRAAGLALSVLVLAAGHARASQYDVHLFQFSTSFGNCSVPIGSDAGPTSAAASGTLSPPTGPGRSGGGSFQAQTSAGEIFADFAVSAIVGLEGTPCTSSNLVIGGCVEATFTIDDVVITGPGADVTTQFSVLAQTATSLSQSGNALIFSSRSVRTTLMSHQLTHTLALDGSATVSSPGVAVPVGQPFSIEVRLRGGATCNVTGICSDPSSASTAGTMSARFAPGPVFDLPPGYTANSADGRIVDNAYSSPTADVPAPGPGTVAAALAPPVPNPLRDDTRFTLTLAQGERARVRIVDLAGRTVRVLHDGPLAAGAHSIRWDGRGAGGRRLPGGVYFCAVQAGAARVTRRTILLQ